ncbi:MAG TPA: tetratricopeptide repeat protein [Actinomycetota bacterium]|nr:tetratricopeptide repeat protein [Actinomycetota bacterium]
MNQSPGLIRTPDQRLRVYVSGDTARLFEERRTARAAIESLHLTPVTVDVEGSAGRRVSAAYLSQSNAFVGVYEALGEGAIADATLQEFELAEARDLPKLLYVRATAGAVTLPPYLDAAAQDGTPVKRFMHVDELHDLVRDDLAALLSQRFAASVAQPAPAPAVAAAAPKVRLPVQLTPFVGRSKEVGEVAALLVDASTRLVTLSGPGGIGKSRLAYEVASAVADRFADGVTVVPLSAVADPHLVIPAIARALDVKESAERTLVENLKELLRTKEMLLVLDNFEHVVSAAHHLAGVLEACRGVKLLVTSRAVLFIRGELEYRVPPLRLPADTVECTAAQVEQFEAVRLFVQRARAADPSFALTDANAATITQICARLDGLPLAIELAAARARLLGPDAILSRLAHRLQLLTGGPVDLPERQQTLRATLDWDYDLLEEEEQEVFRKLAVFSGGFTLAAAERVIGPDADVFEIVESLTSKSLLSQGEAAGDARFFMLRTLREYAYEKLDAAGDTAEVRNAHAAFFLRLAEEAGPELKGPDQIRWLDVLDHEADNMRGALRWAAESGDHETELRLAAALGEYWEFRAHLSEGQRVLEDALARTDAAPAHLRAPCLECAAVMARGQGEYKRAVTFVEQAIGLYDEIGDEHALSRALKQRGIIASERGDPETARSFYLRSLEIKQKIGDRRGIAEAQNNLGVLARLAGDLDEAIAQYGAALEYFRDAGDQKAIARILMNLGEARMEKGELGAAEDLIAESLRLCIAIGSEWDITDLLELMGTVQSGFGNAAEAATLFGAGQALRDLLGAPLPEAELETYRARLSGVKAALDPDEFDAAWERGRALSGAAAVEYALGLQRSAASG